MCRKPGHILAVFLYMGLCKKYFAANGRQTKAQELLHNPVLIQLGIKYW